MTMSNKRQGFPKVDEIGRIFPHVGSSIWCCVAGRTAVGAELSVISVLGIPQRFTLVIVDTGERFLAETVRMEAWTMSVRLRPDQAFGDAERARALASAAMN